ncbi:class I SAM-dependent methyltransferase [Floridanema aerugineum]|jgi:predicted SAM-dependent methyltransferase|uniref:Methyltransferase domain-containing protein n=1 Tax=Floridaenema aerugineum BLCC-F46 TaxID=3153654 RepID=A0ABV4XET8_9CYAN
MKLHIGGTETHPDWKILDVEARPEVDFVGNAANLEQFADNSIEAIYASHVLEHFHHGLNNELLNTLKEWYRVLQPGGKLYISVPNLRVLCWLYLNDKLSVYDRYYLMAVMFGGQKNEYDVHKVGFDLEILSIFLREVGFINWTKVESFGFFNDTSIMRVENTLISLNVIATK